MQNFGNDKTSILTELPLGNAELGESFAIILNDMILQSGIPNPKGEDFDITSKKWREIANKPDKTSIDIRYLDDTLLGNINELAQSYILFIAKKVGNRTGKLSYEDYEEFSLMYRFGHYDVENRPKNLAKIKIWLKNAFDKISAHGEIIGDELIDKNDMAAYLYAIATTSQRDSNGKFIGLKTDGIIKKRDFAVCEKLLFEQEQENIFTLKLKIAYNLLKNYIQE